VIVETPQKAPAATTARAAAARPILRDCFMTNLGSVDEPRRQKVAWMTLLKTAYVDPTNPD
jgi:hypothetical protein